MKTEHTPECSAFMDRLSGLLTAEWQRLPDLNRKAGTAGDPFRDLRDAGKAEEKREPIARDGFYAGKKIFYRRKS